MSKEKTAFIPKQYFAVVAVLLAIMMSVLDGTIMNIALPTLAHDFDVTPSNAIWIVNAYQLVITMTLLSFASLGDIYGYRRIFLTGISIFAGASLACALSDSFWMLTVSRIIQGFGAACVMSVNTALIRLIYPPQDTRARNGRKCHGGSCFGRRRSIHCRQYLSIGKLALAFCNQHSFGIGCISDRTSVLTA